MQRIEAGSLRGRKLLPLPAGVPGLRPTGARVRGAIRRVPLPRLEPRKDRREVETECNLRSEGHAIGAYRGKERRL